MRRHWLVVLVMLFLVCSSAPARAAITWCKADPVVRINGTKVRFTPMIPQEYIHLVDGPIHFVLKTPAKKKWEVLYVDNGFNNKGEQFTWTTLTGYRTGKTFDIQVEVSVSINTSASVPLRVEMIPDNGKKVVYQGTHKQTSFMTTVTGKY
jgi:hypothetical protein